jgi:hypothetical protein
LFLFRDFRGVAFRAACPQNRFQPLRQRQRLRIGSSPDERIYFPDLHLRGQQFVPGALSGFGGKAKGIQRLMMAALHAPGLPLDAPRLRLCASVLLSACQFDGKTRRAPRVVGVVRSRLSCPIQQQRNALRHGGGLVQQRSIRGAHRANLPAQPDQ